MRWLKHDLERRSSYLPELMDYIPFNLLSLDYLITNVQKDEIIKSNNKCIIKSIE